MKIASGKKSLCDLDGNAIRKNRMLIEQLTRDKRSDLNLAGNETRATSSSRMKSSTKNSLGKYAGPPKSRLIRTITVQASRDVKSTSCLSLIHSYLIRASGPGVSRMR